MSLKKVRILLQELNLAIKVYKYVVLFIYECSFNLKCNLSMILGKNQPQQ